MKHLEWPRHPYKVMPQHIWAWAWTRNLAMKWRLTRAMNFRRRIEGAIKCNGF